MNRQRIQKTETGTIARKYRFFFLSLVYLICYSYRRGWISIQPYSQVRFIYDDVIWKILWRFSLSSSMRDFRTNDKIIMKWGKWYIHTIPSPINTSNSRFTITCQSWKRETISWVSYISPPSIKSIIQN